MAFSLTFYLTCIFLFLFHFPRATVSALQEIWTNWQWDWLKEKERGRQTERECEWDRESESGAWDDRADIQPAIFAFGAFKKLIQIKRAGSVLLRGVAAGRKSKKTWKLDFLIFYAVITAFCGLKTHTPKHTHTRTQYKIHAKIHTYI